MDYKLKYGKSPDLGDCLVGLTEVARLRGFRLSAVGNTVNLHTAWEDRVKQSQEVYSNSGYSPEEEYEQVA